MTLTADQIIEAAEDVLRRFGPAKTTVVDVARALGVSHGSVYRHFASKKALRDAVTKRWLARLMAPLDRIVESSGPAAPRLRDWLAGLWTAKRRYAQDDPELFATYTSLVAESGELEAAHVAHMTEHVARILADGVRSGEFAVADPAATARAVLMATDRFHHPAHAPEWNRPGVEDDFERVWALIHAGLTNRED